MTEAININNASVDEFTAKLRSIFPATPLQRNAFLSARFQAEIWLKREDLSPVRSYKIRGAINAVQSAEQGVIVCASAGNHAQGVAFACRHFDRKGVIFMPVTTPKQKIDKTRVFGGEQIEIRLTGDYFDETLAAAQAYCSAQGGLFIPPFDAQQVIEGQASVASEILSELPQAPDLMVLPVGGGGLAAGLCRYFANKEVPSEFRFVEPEGGPSLQQSLREGAQVTLSKVDNFVDGAAVARIGDHPWSLLRHYPADHALTVAENRICATIVEMLNHEGIVLEPAGALAIDALRDLADEIRGKRVVCIVSGGNFDFERLPDVKERALRWEGLKKYFILRLPQRPGALRDFLELLGPDDDITRFEYLKKSARNFGSVLLGLETHDVASFPLLLEKMEAAGFSYIDITDNDMITGLII